MKQLKHIRLATPEEVEAIRPVSNFSPKFMVWAMDNNEGSPDLAVIKEPMEVDPVIFGPHTSNTQKALFIWALEERLAGMGIQQYRFTVDDRDEQWKTVIESWGGRRLNSYPEARFEKVIG